MHNLFIDCSLGLSGDMLLASLIDMGTPIKVVEEALIQLGIESKCTIQSELSFNHGFRGARFFAKSLNNDSKERSWLDINHLISQSSLKEEVKLKALEVYKILAEAEASVHGIEIEKVHFHEIGSIGTMVDIVGVCVALDYLNLNNIFSTFPPAGSGKVKMAHGELLVPVPVVLELAKNHQITLSGTTEKNAGEQTTPSGLALLIVYADYFIQPESFLIQSIGIGLGSRKSNTPNLVRICLLKDPNYLPVEKKSEELMRSFVISQEAWIDDASAEDLSLLINQLRDSGALEVVSESIHMKKGRIGTSVKALVNPEDAKKLRLVWLSNYSTIGIRERIEDRWILKRRLGNCKTSFGMVLTKQVKRPDGRYTLKPEFDELSRISCQTGLPIEQIRNEILNNSETFFSEEDWEY